MNDTIDASKAADRRATDPRAVRPRLLLHVCCAPCATHAVATLLASCDVTLFFSNSNVAPDAEYERRLAAARALAAHHRLLLIEDAYDHTRWLEHICGLEDAPERGPRCRKCFEFSLRRTAETARERGFDAFTTTLSISPHKRSRTLFEVGRGLGPFLEIDFKKHDGFKHSLQLSRELSLYRQDFCGCEFSRRKGSGT